MSTFIIIYAFIIDITLSFCQYIRQLKKQRFLLQITYPTLDLSFYLPPIIIGLTLTKYMMKKPMIYIDRLSVPFNLVISSLHRTYESALIHAFDNNLMCVEPLFDSITRSIRSSLLTPQLPQQLTALWVTHDVF